MKTHGNGNTDTLTMLEDITARLAAFTPETYIRPDRAADPRDQVIGVCTPHMMAIYSLGASIANTIEPLVQEHNRLATELTSMLESSGSLTAMVDAVDNDDVRTKTARMKALLAQTQPQERIAKLIDALLAAEIGKHFPDAVSKKIAIDDEWRIVYVSRRDEIADMFAAAGLGNHRRRHARLDA